MVMSIASQITTLINEKPPGQPFTNSGFLHLGLRSSINRALSRLVNINVIVRITRGVYVRPRQNRYIGNVMPDVHDVLKVIAEQSGETIQLHGAEAARRLKLSSQVPVIPIFYTSGRSRQITIGKLAVKLKHASHRKLQLAGTGAGLALVALWYLGSGEVTSEIVDSIKATLTGDEYQSLINADIPSWMAKALNSN